LKHSLDIIKFFLRINHKQQLSYLANDLGYRVDCFRKKSLCISQLLRLITQIAMISFRIKAAIFHEVDIKSNQNVQQEKIKK
jgi:hypothetical protein